MKLFVSIVLGSAAMWGLMQIPDKNFAVCVTWIASMIFWHIYDNC